MLMYRHYGTWVSNLILDGERVNQRCNLFHWTPYHPAVSQLRLIKLNSLLRNWAYHRTNLSCFPSHLSSYEHAQKKFYTVILENELNIYQCYKHTKQWQPHLPRKLKWTSTGGFLKNKQLIKNLLWTEVTFANTILVNSHFPDIKRGMLLTRRQHSNILICPRQCYAVYK